MGTCFQSGKDKAVKEEVQGCTFHMLCPRYCGSLTTTAQQPLGYWKHSLSHTINYIMENSKTTHPPGSSLNPNSTIFCFCTQVITYIFFCFNTRIAFCFTIFWSEQTNHDYRIYSAIRRKISPMKVCYNMSFTFPKQSQRSRSIL